MRTRFEDLSREQISSLSEEDKRYYIDFRLAENGVVLPPHPGEAPETPDFPNPTEIAYECRGIIVTDIEEAKLIATLESVMSENYINSMYDRKYLEEHGSYGTGIEKKVYYKKSVVAEHATEMKRAKDLKSEYDTQLNNYKKAVESSSEITGFIDNICYAVNREAAFLEQAKTRAEGLAELTDHNDQITYNFFVKAYPVEETVEKLQGFYEEDSITGIKPFTYEQFAAYCEVKIPEKVIDNEM